ncbi:MAG TPA: threonine--tRNA ligase [Acidimicrobiia bacterium]|nr:threonine--tRNA ligase [Acidimicrobiia bacterium]
MGDRITITLPDGSSREHDRGTTPAQVAEAIGKRLAKAAVAAVADGEWVDLGQQLDADTNLRIVTADSDAGREVLRHSSAHVMAQAVTDLFPGAKYAIGPAITDGFYYDFELPDGASFSDADLERIEARMAEIVAADQPFVRAECSFDAALDTFADQPYKREIIEKVRDGAADADDASEAAGGDGVSLYRNPRADGADFVDLCRGPHVPSTARIGAFKLMKVAGAYWRGNEKGPMLQRIYGTAWESKAALDEHLHRLAEAERRDHRRLGVELDLYSFPDELGGGLAVWHPKGATIRRAMEDFSRAEHERADYEMVFTPHIAKSVLWETSGHLDWYAEGMYPAMELDGATYYPKPMNCPFHILIFRAHTRSYRELPKRIFELGTVYRYERSGVLHGLLRTRGFTQDDAHIFCEPDQVVPELNSLLDFVLRMLRAFGFSEFEADLSTRPDGKSVGSDADWDLATRALFEALDASGLPYEVAEGEGAFYGPKIDIHVRDAIGRRWQLSTLQVDFQLPQRFDLHYVGADNERHRPIMIHRALFGSVERFFGILVEHYAGAFPVWLAPVQVTVLPVADRHDTYARRVVDRLRSEGFRAEMVDAASGALGARIRRAKVEKVPYVLVVGDDDAEHGTVGVNARGSDDPERGVKVDDFIDRLAATVVERV